MASLISLPPEILHRICRFLGRTEKYSIRLTCRTLASASYDQFAKQEVSEVYLALTSDGLESLKELSSLGTLRTYVKELWILPTLFGNHYTWTLKDITELDNRTYKLFLGSSPGANPRERVPLRGQVVCDGGRLPSPKTNQKNKKQYRLYQDAVADLFRIILESVKDADGSSDMTYFQATLTHCLPFFPNLRAMGLRDTYHERGMRNEALQNARRKVRGVQKLEKVLGFEVIHPPTGAIFDEPDPDFTRHFYTTLLQSRLFTSLMVAIGATSTRVETFHSSGLMADDGLSITQDEEDALRPILYGIRDLSLNICSAHVQEEQRSKLQHAELDSKLAIYFESSTTRHPRPDTNPDRLLPVLAQAGPNLDSLHLACPGGDYAELCERKPALGLVDAHFDRLASQFQFTRLSVLSLRQIMTSLPTFMKFLDTARFTLRELTMDDIVWTNDRPFVHGNHEKQAQAEEAVQLMREIATHLRDSYTLRFLVIGTWTYQDRKIAFFDPLNHHRDSFLALYNAKHATVSFSKWIDQLRFRVRVALGERRRWRGPRDFITFEG